MSTEGGNSVSIPTGRKRKEKIDVPPVRLDLKTRITLMASIIYGTYPDLSIEEAVERAIKIENAAELGIRKLKSDNPRFLHRGE